VQWDGYARALDTSAKFVNWLVRQPWDPELLSAPAVQDGIDRVHRSGAADERRRMGAWLQGISGLAGAPRRIDHTTIKAHVSMAHRQLERLAERLSRVRNPQSVWTEAKARHARIVGRLERAGLDVELRDHQPKHWGLRRLACELVAHENNLGKAYVAQIARRKRS